MGWACKDRLKNLQGEIFFKINALKRGQDQERISLKEGTNLNPMRQGISLTAQIHHYIDRKAGLNHHPLKSINNIRVH